MKKLTIILAATFVFFCGVAAFPHHTHSSIYNESKLLRTLEEKPLVKFLIRLEKSQRGRQLVEAINKFLDDSLNEAVDDNSDEDQRESRRRRGIGGMSVSDI